MGGERKPGGRTSSKSGGKPAPAGRTLESCGPAPAGRPKKASRRPWSLYVAECSDGSLYVGIAKDVEKRLAVHNSGRGAKYTSTRRPVRLVYSESCADVSAALRREREIKRWSRPKKLDRLGLEGPARLGRASSAGGGPGGGTVRRMSA